ncbi:MAG: type 3 dihydrofolate reductase [Chitinophagaceae bacterium]|jgi:dihydrofolate reductase|nr:type 3 dihydrofolate reductase [Chitinophagaceae bacterium]MBP6588556.1 type 3 dihydrofolate reductase [Chitinophagaceae bacterium]
MTISLIVAAANNNAIGKEGGMPWHLPNDLRHFKNLTWGMPVVMGRKTFESLGKPLAGRKNIVISRQQGWSAPGAVVVKSIEDALFVAREADMKEVMVIGGGEIYKSLFDRAKRIYLTRVEAEPDADTFFPVIDPQQWHLMSQKNHEADEKNAYNYSFQVWERLN